jgi:RND family efflux transporter MFP subunit
VQFKVEPFPDEVFEGRVSNISPAVNQQTRTFTVEILVSNPRGRLKPGFFAKGAILTERDDNVLAVPQAALSTLAGVSSVYVIENGAVRQQNIKLGVQEGDFYEVLEGLKGNETLAASRLNEITTGMTVRPISENIGTTSVPPQGDAGAAKPPASGQPDSNRGGSGARRGDGGN